jgi:peptide chain release factor 1
MTLEEVNQEYQQLLTKLVDPESASDASVFQDLLRQKARLEKVIEKSTQLQEVKRQIEESKTLLAGQEAELAALAEHELKELLEKQKKIEAEIESWMSDVQPSPTPAMTAAIVEIRAGVGGEEAALFARNLFEMYAGFGRSQAWQLNLLDANQSDLNGFKEVIFEIHGPGVLEKMKFEAGVHRVQRIPLTEKSGRVHTSTATVAVLAKPKKESWFQIRSQDVKIDFFNATGPGGQNVNKRKTAVRLTHLPSGLVITSRTERSQLQNKENALAILAAKLNERETAASSAEASGSRRAQIGFAERAEKIRTYNFPQDRLTDHRLKKTWHNLEAILSGKLDDVVEALQKTKN